MVLFDAVWQFIAGKGLQVGLEMKAGVNFLGSAALIKTNLRAGLSEVTTASDASSSGGAVGKAVQLTD